jgi:hypothetical protein
LLKSLCLRDIATLSFALVVGSTEAIPAQTTTDPPLVQTDAPTNFDIPALPLIRALDTYSATTGLMVLYDSALAEGRRSTAVTGTLVPDVAIRVLLEGTGLVVFNTGRAFAIEAAPSDQQDATSAFGAAELPYLALVQRVIAQGFCERAETRPGGYRAALQFRIGTSGEVLSPELLSSTGDQSRDRMIVELLGRLRIGRGPPPGVAQPVSMIISPRPPAQSGDCSLAKSLSRDGPP